MKVYSIGREAGCDIVINDRTNVISRRHAVLTVSGGKMTITDQSSNGTYVNGIRISPNVPVPVTRKDNISFAHVARLDWSLIPNNRAAILWWVLGVAAAILLIVGGIFGYKMISKPKAPETAVDTTIVTREQMEQELIKNREAIEQQLKDSLRQDSIRKDSIKKVEQKRQDSIRAAKRPTPKPTPKPAPKPTPKKDDAQTKPQPPTPSTTTEQPKRLGR